jgi:hypothetical protein
MKHVIVATTLCVASSLLAGCLSAAIPVTGQDPQAPTWKGAQSETASSVANFNARQVLAVAFNDDNPSPGKIQYTATTRTVLSGASLMGWAYSDNSGASWKYGGDVVPPKDWPVLWGDPAIVSSGNDQRSVFMSSLAVPQSKMPASGSIDGSMAPYIGGACIARSADGGKSFAVYQCVHNNFEFYDGGNMASSTLGEIYAAYIATDSFRYDIWYAKDENAQFVRLPDPFPDCRMAMHPRIRVGYPAIGLGAPDPSLFVAGQILDCKPGALGKEQSGGYGQIIINRYHRGGWGTPRVIGKPSAVNPDVQLSDRILRTGPQFSFDVGAASRRDDDQSGNDEIRMLYTRSDGKRLWVEGSFCPYDLSSPCSAAPEWGSTPGYYSYQGDQFTPNVRAFPGFLLIPSAWAATFVSRDHDPGGNTVKIRRGSLGVLSNGARLLIAFNLINPLLVCPDKRGYWGDYDDLQFIGFVNDTTTAQFLRTFTDSSAGCTQRWQYTSGAVHVGSALFP